MSGKCRYLFTSTVLCVGLWLTVSGGRWVCSGADAATCLTLSCCVVVLCTCCCWLVTDAGVKSHRFLQWQMCWLILSSAQVNGIGCSGHVTYENVFCHPLQVAAFQGGEDAVLVLSAMFTCDLSLWKHELLGDWWPVQGGPSVSWLQWVTWMSHSDIRCDVSVWWTRWQAIHWDAAMVFTLSVWSPTSVWPLTGSCTCCIGLLPLYTEIMFRQLENKRWLMEDIKKKL